MHYTIDMSTNSNSTTNSYEYSAQQYITDNTYYRIAILRDIHIIVLGHKL